MLMKPHIFHYCSSATYTCDALGYTSVNILQSAFAMRKRNKQTDGWKDDKCRQTHGRTISISLWTYHNNE